MSITPEERRALLFLAFLLLAGSLVRFAQTVSPRWTPDLKPLGPVAGSAPGPAIAPDPEEAEAPPNAAHPGAATAGPLDAAAGGAPPPGAADEKAPAAPYRAGRLDLNGATAKDLAELPGIGEKLASRIIADREANGPFTSVDDLNRVPGIGPAKLARMRDGVFVGTDTKPR